MNEPRLSRGEYWLLESVVEHELPLSWLLRPDLDQAVNKTAHGLPRADLVDTLVRLVEQGLIRTRTESRGEFVPTRVEIEAALDACGGPRNWRVDYALTPSGGAAWEAFAAPDWDRFIQEDVADAAHEIAETTAVCANLRWLRGYVAAIREETDLDEASLRFDEVTPGAATYWRQLPHGHRARFRYREREGGPEWASPPSYRYRRWYQWG